MVPETHRIIAGEVRNRIIEDYGIILDESKMLRGSIAPDVYPKYKFIPHYYDESIDYIVEKIVALVPYMSELVYDTAWKGLLNLPVSYKIGVISHYLCDYMTHPHARRIRCTSMKDMKSHMLYEKDLNRHVRKHGVDRDCICNMEMGSFQGDKDDLRVYVKEQIAALIELYKKETITFRNDANFAYIVNVFISNVVCEAALSYQKVGQVQMA